MLELLVPRASTYAEDIDQLFDIITYLVGFWFLLVLAFFFYVLFRFRRKAGQKAQYITGDTHKQRMAVEIPHYLILVCDAVILIMTFLVWHTVKIELPENAERIRIVSQQWAWSFYHAGEDGLLGTKDDIPLVNELRIQVDKPYIFELESIDVMHSFSVPVFRLKQDSIPGRVIEGHFTATKTGNFMIQCAEMCGIGHGYMPANLIIESEEDHLAWIDANTPDAGSYAAAETSAKEDDNNG